MIFDPTTIARIVSDRALNRDEPGLFKKKKGKERLAFRSAR